MKRITTKMVKLSNLTFNRYFIHYSRHVKPHIDLWIVVLIYSQLIRSIPCPTILPTVEHLRLFLPKRRSNHTRVGKRRRSAAETGPGERRDPEPALPPCPPFRLPLAVPVRQAGRVVC